MKHLLFIAAFILITVKIVNADPEKKDPCRKTLDEIASKIFSNELDVAFKRMSPTKPNLKMKKQMKTDKEMRERVGNSFKNTKYSRTVGKLVEYTSVIDGESANMGLVVLPDGSCLVSYW